ncbi:NRDE family protein [Simiduia agarivorans]|uniref:NRDE family protein n=1 Tax=Simiduia agarivorans (strain DSM 21679 / JCM 13881 / BCRC 17597 / SA1) TaxID=1117647 RepID=K4KP10_SIMAS|nr:NRDE family protein [Simiduia agarivorans]AFU99848.1 hypothetical protein M5M_13540 [Simiduia agarivorans SA1 = DSM 21679]
MCLIFLAIQQHPRWPLIVAANRDEFHHRLTRPAQRWPEQPQWLGGKDLQAGGSWLMASEQARWAALTNIRNPAAPVAQGSRGTLILDALRGRAPALNADVGGYNLLKGELSPGGWQIDYHTNGGGIHPPGSQRLKPGCYGLSNAGLDSPWPKVTQGKSAFVNAVGTEEDADLRQALWALLAHRATADTAELPDTGVGLEWETRLSARFIVSPDYGTRASSLLLLDGQGRGQLWERQFDNAGEMQNEVCLPLLGDARL